MSETKTAQESLQELINETKRLDYAVEKNADMMGRLLVGKLHHVSAWHLRKLKRELARWNMHTGKWK
jgi:hypothetical protein